MRRWKLTQAGLRDIEKDFATKHKGADKIYFDTEIKGFGFRCRRGGSRTWVLVYERNNEQRKLVLGPWPVLTPDQARSKAREEIGKVWLGADPQGSKAEERAKSRLTLLSVIEQYLQSSAVKELRQSSLTDVKRYLLGTDNVEHFRPLHKIPVHKIAKRDVAIILIKIANTAPVAAKSARSVLSGLFDWAIARIWSLTIQSVVPMIQLQAARQESAF